jgi:methylmalonyl-CoA/ethylmalonyl-CoA epimerase
MSLVKKIDHIAIAVSDINASSKFFVDVLGLEISPPEDVVEQKTRVAFVQVGEVRIELVQPMSDDSPVAKHIAKRGQGIHHIAYETDDIVGALDALQAKDVPLIDKAPRVGAHDAKIAFVHPKGVSGVLTELCEHTSKH